MLISFTHQFIFFSVPKTASTSVETALRSHCDIIISDPPRLKHTNVKAYEAKLQPYFEDKQTRLDRIAIIREPIDWLYSWYCYRARDDIRGQDNSTADMRFEDFVHSYMEQPRPAFANVGQQSVFLTAKQSDTLAVDYLFRFEALQLVKAFFEDRLSTSLDIPHLNASKKRDGDLSAGVKSKLETYLTLDFQFYEDAIF